MSNVTCKCGYTSKSLKDHICPLDFEVCFPSLKEKICCAGDFYESAQCISQRDVMKYCLDKQLVANAINNAKDKKGNERKINMKQKIDLNKLSFEDLKKEVENLSKRKEEVSTKKVGVWEVGKHYVIRTVTMIDVGKLIEVTDNELVLENASWIADTGRWNEFLKNGTYTESEPFPDGKVIVGRSAIIDAVLWKHGEIRNVK